MGLINIQYNRTNPLGAVGDDNSLRNTFDEVRMAILGIGDDIAIIPSKIWYSSVIVGIGMDLTLEMMLRRCSEMKLGSVKVGDDMLEMMLGTL